jgi:hypothetical protein
MSTSVLHFEQERANVMIRAKQREQEAGDTDHARTALLDPATRDRLVEKYDHA